jgi:hypothetical protein
MEGDDRAAFLQHESSDLLYWWQVLDRHQLIQFTCAKLTGENAVNCDGTAPVTSARKRAKVASSGSSLTAYVVGEESFQKEGSENIADISRKCLACSDHTISFSHKSISLRQILASSCQIC